MIAMIQPSEVSLRIQPSLTRKLFNMAKAYDDVIDFTLGDPDMPPHRQIQQAGCEAILKGKTRYSQNAGLLELREVISARYRQRENLVYNPETEIIVTVGAMEGLYLALLSLLNPGDEVIIPAPYWINYSQMVELCHAVPVIVNPEDGLQLSLDAVEQAITPRTKIIIINTPSNPSGLIYSDETLGKLSELAIQKNLLIIADEVYKTLLYENQTYTSIAAYEGMKERTVLVNSLSKEFCMTGWRIGYVLAPSELVAVMTKLQENVVACAPLPSQYAAIEALKGGAAYSLPVLEEFTRRRNTLVDGLSRIKKLSVCKPQGTFYALINVRETGLNSEEFAYALLQKEQVAVVPGITYGNCCADYVRIAFTLDEEKIKEGIERIERFVEAL